MKESFQCQMYLKMDILVYNFIMSVTHIVAALSMIPTLIIYCGTYQQSKSNTAKLLFWTGFTIFITIFLFLITYGIAAASLCQNNNLFVTSFSVSFILYLIQSGMYLQLLFGRLYIIFHDTSYRLSKWTIRAWILYVLLVAISFTIGFILYSMTPSLIKLGIFILSICVAANCASSFWLVVLFLYKLISVYKYRYERGSNNTIPHEVVSLMTKTSVLCFISIFTNLLVSMIVHPLAFQSVYKDMVWRILIVVDVYTNHFCVLLSYIEFQMWYTQLCGCFDSYCNSLWSCCFGQRHLDIITNTSFEVQSPNDMVLKTNISMRSMSESNQIKKMNI
eukprot:78085_1